MNEIKRKIHVIGINSYKFEELPKKLQNLFIKIDNIAVPDTYFSEINLWSKKNSTNKKNLFASKSDNKLIHWLIWYGFHCKFCERTNAWR